MRAAGTVPGRAKEGPSTRPRTRPRDRTKGRAKNGAKNRASARPGPVAGSFRDRWRGMDPYPHFIARLPNWRQIWLTALLTVTVGRGDRSPASIRITQGHP